MKLKVGDRVVVEPVGGDGYRFEAEVVELLSQQFTYRRDVGTSFEEVGIEFYKNVVEVKK